MRAISPKGRFARVEWERRFLLAQFPVDIPSSRVRQIQDRYIRGTRLRLRRLVDADGTSVFKLTQKLDEGARGALQGHITTLYLSEEEYSVLVALPARLIEKQRYSVAPFGIDIFRGNLSGLIMAEAEFDSAEEAAALELPVFLGSEVTSDQRFTGGCLARTTRQQLVGNLAEFGLALNSP